MQTALSHYQTFQISDNYKIPSSLHNLLAQAWHNSYEELYEESTEDTISLVVPATWCLQFPKTLYTIKGLQDTKSIKKGLYNGFVLDSTSNKTNDIEANRKSSEEYIMKDETGRSVRNLLEDFGVIGTDNQMVLLPASEFYSDLRKNVQTAVAATFLGLSSLDYTRKAYVEDMELPQEVETSLDKEYKRAYFLAKNYIHEARKRLITSENDHPSLEVFGASGVLERLQSSLFSAHLLYSLGNVYEGHAVSRVMLEQIAWAYEASGLNDREAISKIKPNKAISKLKNFLPKVGKLYGHLSKHTHIDYHRHHEFIKIENNQNIVLLGQDRLDECAMVILHLADIFVAVWEFSQQDHLKEFTAIGVRNNSVYLLDNRKFLGQIESVLEKIKLFEN